MAPSDDEQDPPPIGRVGTVLGVGLALLLLLALGLGVRTYVVDDDDPFLELGLLLWGATVVLAVASAAVLREWRSTPRAWLDGEGRQAGRPAHDLAVRVLTVLATLATGGLAAWVTFDQADNLESYQILALVRPVGDGLDGERAAPSVVEVQVALALVRDDEEVTDERVTADLSLEPRGLRVQQRVSLLDDDEVRFEITDDDGGSPVCLVFTRADDETFDSYAQSGIC